MPKELKYKKISWSVVFTTSMINKANQKYVCLTICVVTKAYIQEIMLRLKSSFRAKQTLELEN